MEITENEILVKNPKGGLADVFPLGVIDITSDHVTFLADQECAPMNYGTDGTYTYAVEAEGLTFTKIDDSCRERTALLVAAPWVRKT